MVRRLTALVALVSACRTVSPVHGPFAQPSRDMEAAAIAISQARLDEAERIAGTLDRTNPAEAALTRLYIAERRHDVAAVHALATGPAGALLRADRWRLTALARGRYWTEGLAAAHDDLKAACESTGEPDLGPARTNACALARQAELLGPREANVVRVAAGAVKLLPNQSVLVGAVRFSSHKAAAAIIDTGAPTTVVARRYADRAHIPYRQDVQESSSDGGGNRLLLSPTILDEIGLGTATAANVGAHVIDMPPVFRVAGILAPQEAFRGAAIEFDLRAHVVRVLPGQDAAAWAAIVGEPIHTVPVLWMDGNMAVPAHVGGQLVWLRLDTGADRNYACQGVAASAGVMATLGTHEKRSFTAAGTVAVLGGFTATLAVGDSAPTSAEFLVKACPREMEWSNGLPILMESGFLGVPWFLGRRVLLAADGRWLVFTEPKAEPAAPPNS